MEIKDMAYEKGDAMESCRSIGRKFIQHFDKIYNRRDCEAVNHWCGEMQGWFNDAKSIKLKQSKKYIDNDDLWDWFFTAGAEAKDYMLKPNAEEINIYEDFVSDLNITRNVRQSITNVLGIKIIDSLKEGMVMKDSTNMAYEEEFDSWEDLLKEYIKENNLSKYENDIMYYYEFEEFKNLKKFMEKRNLDLEFDDIYKLYTDGEIELEESFIEKNRKYTKDSLKGDNKMKKIVSLKKSTIDFIKKSIKDSEYIGNAKIINADELPNLNDKDKRYNHPAKVTKVKKVDTEKGYDIYEVTYQETESIRHGEGIDTYKFTYAVKNDSTNDSKEDLGWISTPELLEEDDFKSEDAFEYWVEFLTKLKNASSEQERIDILDNSEFYYEDFVNPYVKEEVKNDIKRIYANRKPHYVYSENAKDSLHSKRRKVKDSPDWDFIHKIKNYKYDVVEKAMIELFPKKYLKERFEDEWGDLQFEYANLSIQLDRSKKEKLLNYLDKISN